MWGPRAFNGYCIIHTHTYIYIYIYIYIKASFLIISNSSSHPYILRIYKCVCVCVCCVLCVCVCLYMYVCIYVCMGVCMRALTCVHTHTHTHTRQCGVCSIYLANWHHKLFPQQRQECFLKFIIIELSASIGGTHYQRYTLSEVHTIRYTKNFDLAIKHLHNWSTHNLFIKYNLLSKSRTLYFKSVCNCFRNTLKHSMYSMF